MTLDVFFCGAEVGDGDFLDLAELVLGLSGMVEQQDSDELLCFLEVENLVNAFIENRGLLPGSYRVTACS